jgi:UDP-2-acetamido-2,6-beta-L-arabino-hexul-4-ose reductase
MTAVLVTGSEGFIGKNLVQHLKQLENVQIHTFDIHDSIAALKSLLGKVDFVFHLAGVNRTSDINEFRSGNLDLTTEMLNTLTAHERKIPFLLTSSIKATLDNPYGVSKREAEDAVFRWAENTGGQALVYRLPNVFGKWCRPNYNSVVTTFCYNVANDLPIEIHQPGRQMTLAYIDNVVQEFIQAFNGSPTRGSGGFCIVPKTFEITLQDLADRIVSFRGMRRSLVLPDFSNELTRCLYATYVSYLPENRLGYPVTMRKDSRGWLSELLKSPHFGQVFVSKTKPGITRGDHWHHTKVEKFIVVEGQAVIRFRQIHGYEVIEVPVSGDEVKIVDIPTGYTHSITNIGDTDLITLFWANEIFDPEDPDTYYLEV